MVSVVLLTFTPDGQTLIAAQKWGDAKIHVWDLPSRKERYELTRQGVDHLSGIALSPDGRTLACGGRLNVGMSEGTIPLWDLASGKLLRTLRTGAKGVMGVTFSPDGKTLAACGYDEKQCGSITILDARTGGRVRRMEVGAPLVTVLAFSPAGETLFGAGGPIRRWHVATGRELDPVRDQGGRIWRLALSPDGRVLAAMSQVISLWDVSTGRELHRLVPPQGGVLMDLAFSPDGQTLAAVGRMGWLTLWDVAGGKKIREVQVHALANAGPRRTWENPSAVSFSSDGRSVTTGSWEGAIRLWAIAPGNEHGRLLGRASVEDQAIQSIAPLPDGRTLAVALAAWGIDATVRFWDTATRQPLPHLLIRVKGQDRDLEHLAHELGTAKLALSADGYMWTINRQRGIAVWETASGKERLRLPNDGGPTIACAFAPDGRSLASAGWDGVIRLWDATTGKELGRLRGHRGTVNCLAFSPDGRRLFSGGSDTCVLLWDVAALTDWPAPSAAMLSRKELAGLWGELAKSDALAAYRAINRLAVSPRQAIGLLKKRLEPVQPVDIRRLEALIRDLDDARFAVRRKAAQGLAALGEEAEAALHRVLGAKPTPEVRRQAEHLLERIPIPRPELLQQLRALEVLERIGTPQAAQLVLKLTQGAPRARLTREARAVLHRLARRTAKR
jgi:sugar lactone lactonase YvrE